jgi:superfamily II DNA/RNA helicase
MVLLLKQTVLAPRTQVTHLHRIGRTARAGKSGYVTNIVDDVSRDVARVIQEDAESGASLAPVFSRNRGFRRRLKRHGTGRAELDE